MEVLIEKFRTFELFLTKMLKNLMDLRNIVCTTFTVDVLKE